MGTDESQECHKPLTRCSQIANSKVRPNDVQVVTYLTDRENSDAYGSGKTLPRVICINLFAYVREIERRGCAENGDYEKRKKWVGSLTRG